MGVLGNGRGLCHFPRRALVLGCLRWGAQSFLPGRLVMAPCGRMCCTGVCPLMQASVCISTDESVLAGVCACLSTHVSKGQRGLVYTCASV